MKYTLSIRQKRIIQTLYLKRDWMTGTELSIMIGVSDRTIRSDIDSIKSTFDINLILASKQFGYKFNDEIEYESLNIEEELTTNERIAKIIINLFCEQTGIDYFDAANNLFISESTFLGYIQIIKKHIFEQNLKLKIDKVNYKVILFGDRYEQLKLILHWVKNVLKYSKIDSYSIIFNTVNVELISNMLLELLVEEKYFSRYLSFRSLLISVLLVSEQARIKPRSNQSNSNDMLEIFDNSSLVVKIQQQLADIFNISLDYNDISLLNQLVSKVKPMEEIEELRFSKDIFLDTVYKSLKVIIQEVKNKYHIDLTDRKSVV